MKISLKILFLFFVSSCSNLSGVTKNDLRDQVLHGKVKIQTVKTYEAQEKFGEIVKSKLKSIEIYKFSENGNFSDHETFNSDSILTEKVTSRPNAKGTETNYYRGNGKLISKTVFNISQGILNEIIEYDEDGQIKSKSTYKNNDMGKPLEIIGYDISGQVNYKKIFKYDVKGNVIEYFYYNSSGVMESHDISKYDNNSKEIESISNSIVGGTPMYWKLQYSYNNEGMLIGHKEFTKDNKLKEIFTKEYDKYGNATLMKWHQTDPIFEMLRTYQYTEYDSKSNWKNMLEFENGKAIQVIKQELEYF